MKQIKELREVIGCSQEQLASQIGTDRSTVAKWETGAAMPSAAKLPLLASVLGCTIDELFGRSPPDQAERDSA